MWGGWNIGAHFKVSRRWARMLAVCAARTAALLGTGPVRLLPAAAFLHNSEAPGARDDDVSKPPTGPLVRRVRMLCVSLVEANNWH